MPKADLGLRDQKLLKHFPEHGVLVCKSCQFAIQPSALSSHLLRHQVYRNERRLLLDQLSGLDLREPELVTYPDPDAAAIPELPVYRGWICQMTDCGHACASEKRMGQHWSDNHGSRDVVARPAWLQTFFRGNKIRYFEVSEPAGAPTPVTDDEDEHGLPPTSQTMLERTSTQLSTSTAPSSIMSDEASGHKPSFSTLLTATQLNMLNLELMHHWSTVTSHTAHRGTEPHDYWTQTITKQALAGNQFLMYGSLSAAAFHLASAHRRTPRFHEFREIGLEYQGYGVTAFRHALASGDQLEACLAFNRLLSVTRCAEHHLDPDSTDSAIRPELEGRLAPQLAIVECITLIRNTTDMWCAVQHELPDGSGMLLPHEVLVGLAGIPSDEGDRQWVKARLAEYPSIPPHVFEQVRTIPGRLCAVLRDAIEPDVAAVKHAYACVLTCFDRSFASRELWAKWNGVEAWPTIVSERFIKLLEASHPAALVVLALWALLVKRLEFHCWFLQGETRRLFRFMRQPLDGRMKEVVDEIATFKV